MKPLKDIRYAGWNSADLVEEINETIVPVITALEEKTKELEIWCDGLNHQNCDLFNRLSKLEAAGNLNAGKIIPCTNIDNPPLWKSYKPKDSPAKECDHEWTYSLHVARCNKCSKIETKDSPKSLEYNLPPELEKMAEQQYNHLIEAFKKEEYEQGYEEGHKTGFYQALNNNKLSIAEGRRKEREELREKFDKAANNVINYGLPLIAYREELFGE